MIGFIRGILTSAQPTKALIDVQGMGYNVSIPISTFEKLPEINSEVKLLTHLHVREDNMSLFGFFSQEEKDFFLLLIGVSKIGPKGALGILSGIPINELIQAISSGDVNRISRVPGIGKKTSERLIVELKEKIPDTAGTDIISSKTSDKQKIMVTDTIMALVSLGYAKNKAQDAVRKISKTHNLDSINIEQLVKLSLQVIK
ncbi:Holliday junction branch migration protein RuvA [bacterium]|nr:Holliday junction branch migration protein RuvA [bacterium]